MISNNTIVSFPLILVTVHSLFINMLDLHNQYINFKAKFCTLDVSKDPCPLALQIDKMCECRDSKTLEVIAVDLMAQCTTKLCNH
jgi:hypothetical protein